MSKAKLVQIQLVIKPKSHPKGGDTHTAKEMTPGEKAALLLTIGEKLVELVKETGLLKSKRRKIVRRKRKAKVEKRAEPKVTKPKPAPKKRRDDDDDVPQDR